MKFKDRVVVVTGSSGGIGQALVHRFAELGARLVRADIRQETEVPSVPGRFVRTDVSSEPEVKALIDDVLVREGGINLFVSNAGIYLPMDATASETEWQRIIAVNQMSHVWVARHVVPAMLAAGGGHLAITASGASLLGEIGSIGYTASKYAAFGLAEWLAYSYRDRGVAVSVICPGPISTPCSQICPTSMRRRSQQTKLPIGL